MVANADDLEESEDWDGALRSRIARAEAAPGDKAALMDLCFHCWYVVVEWGCIKSAGLDLERYTKILREVAADVLRRFPDDAEAAWLMGYIMSLFPWEFGEDVAALERTAGDLLERAHRLRPDDPVFLLSHLGNRSDTGEAYWRACDAARLELMSRFPGNGAKDTYFRQVLDRRRPGHERFRQ